MKNSVFIGSAIALALTACSAEQPGNAVAENSEPPAQNMAAMTPDPSNPYGQAEMQMHERMMAATGANASETWARKMIAHHQGAIDMSETLIRQGGDPRLIAAARRTAAMQRREIAELEAMLAGDGSTAASASRPTAPSSEPTAARPEPRAAPAARRPAEKARPADPHAGHDMTTMNHQ